MATNDEKFQSPVKIDVGASARASLEIKGELPSTSLGRLIDNITDIIRPISEARGLKADMLRLQREDVLYEIAVRARRRINVEIGSYEPIPLKVIVPLLEKASLEDPSSKMMNWWADLLASSTQDKGLQHPVYSDVLSKMTAAEASYLERMVSSSNADFLKTREIDLQEVSLSLVSEELATTIDERSQNQSNFNYEQSAKVCFEKFISEVEKNGCVVFSFILPVADIKFSRNLHEQFDPFGRTFQDVTDVIRAIGVGKITNLSFPVPAPYIGEFQCSAEIFSLTSMGRNLLRARIQT